MDFKKEEEVEKEIIFSIFSNVGPKQEKEVVIDEDLEFGPVPRDE